MDAKLRFRLFNSAPITALSYHPLRREIVTGHKDGLIKTWEADTGRNSLVLSKHIGMVTGIIYWYEGRLMLSSSVDGLIVQWAPSGAINSFNDINKPVYSMCWYTHCNRLLIGCKTSVLIFKPSDRHGSLGLPLLTSTGSPIEGHADVIKCIEVNNNKVYTAGYDKRLCIYEVSPLSGDPDDLRLTTIKENAHSNAITCLKAASKIDCIFTGSIDQQVKVWTGDGKFLYSIQLLNTVTDVELVLETGLLWVATIGSNTPFHYDAKTGDKISDFLDPVPHSMRITSTETNQNCQYYIQAMKYISDTSELIGLLSSKEVVLLRYNVNATVCCHQIQWEIECLTYTKKIPLLLFSGTSTGKMLKWERMQLNRYDYSKELLFYEEALSNFLDSDMGQKNLSLALGKSKANVPAVQGRELSERESEIAKAEVMKADNRAFLKAVFIESLDYLISSSRDGKIFVWGFDTQSAEALRSIYSKRQSLSPESCNSAQGDEDAVTYNRVAGFTIQYVLEGHFQPVQALVVVEQSKKTDCVCLISAGWDLSICVWNLENGELVAHKNDCIPSTDDYHDLLITDISYSPFNDTFVFSTTNSFSYMMSFSLNHSEIRLLKTLSGHTNEVTQVCWNPCTHQWVTGSHDQSILLWSTEGVCVNTIQTSGRVYALVIDPDNNLIIAGVGESINVYDGQLDLVQVCNGHTENIKDIIYLPEESEYISTSYDKTLRVWNSYKSRRQSKGSFVSHGN